MKLNPTLSNDNAVDPLDSLAISHHAPEIKPAAVMTADQWREFNFSLKELRDFGKVAYRMGDAVYVLDLQGIKSLYGESDPQKALVRAKQDIAKGNDSALLGKPIRPENGGIDVAIDRNGQILTNPTTIQEESAAGNIMEHAQAGSEDEAAEYADRMSRAIGGMNGTAY